MDDENPADRILEGYKPPTRALRKKAWADLPDPERARLEHLDRERDENGDRVWQQWIFDDPDDPEEMRMLILQPVDQWDTRSELIGRWLRVAEEGPEGDARAVADEHNG